MKRCVVILPLVLLFGIVLSGCDQPAPVAGGKTSGGPPAPPPETKVGVYAGSLDDLAAPANAPPPAAPAPAQPESDLVKAEQGVGARGRSLDQLEGPIVTPAKVYFSVREKVVFNIQIPDALNKYKAVEGQAPKSHEEFMEKIVQANQIKLPVLKPGHEYVYDVASETLMVKQPRQQ